MQVVHSEAAWCGMNMDKGKGAEKAGYFWLGGKADVQERWRRSARVLMCFVGCAALCGCSCIKTSGELLRLVFDRPVAIEEADSSAHILALEIGECDYYIDTDSVRAISHRDGRKASIGTAENGMCFDGERAYRYWNGEAVPMDDFPWEQVDELANEYLTLIQAIVQGGYFTSYNHDEDSEFFGQLFYYLVSPEGMELVDNPACEHGLIYSEYRNGTFQNVTLELHDAEGKYYATCEFGTLFYRPNLDPPQ